MVAVVVVLLVTNGDLRGALRTGAGDDDPVRTHGRILKVWSCVPTPGGPGGLRPQQGRGALGAQKSRAPSLDSAPLEEREINFTLWQHRLSRLSQHDSSTEFSRLNSKKRPVRLKVRTKYPCLGHKQKPAHNTKGSWAGGAGLDMFAPTGGAAGHSSSGSGTSTESISGAARPRRERRCTRLSARWEAPSGRASESCRTPAVHPTRTNERSTHP